MEKLPKISAVIITYNEEKNIARCINSVVNWVDEIVVVDSFSTDSTLELAKSLGAVVTQHAFGGYIEQKNYALQQAKNEWILSLDADEEVSENLKKSILAIENWNHASIYSFNRLSNYCGQWIKHCGWYPDVKTRLFRKDSGSWGGKNPHDKYIANVGITTQHLKGDLLHYTFYTVEQHQQQIHKFSSIAAQSYYDKGIRSNRFKLVFSPLSKFVRNYILKMGFLDGYYGWVICSQSAKATYLKYAKLKNIQETQAV